MRRQGQGELVPFDPKQERTRIDYVESNKHKKDIKQPCRIRKSGMSRRGGDNGYNGNNGRNNAPRPFIQLDDPHMMVEEFALPPTVVQSAIRRPPIHMLQNIQFHRLASENPNTHLTNFVKVCDTIKYNGVIDEALRLRLFSFSLSDKAKHWLTSQPPDSITSWNDLV